MTATNMDLKELLEKTADTDFLREMIGYTAQRLMDVEVEALTGAVGVFSLVLKRPRNLENSEGRLGVTCEHSHLYLAVSAHVGSGFMTTKFSRRPT